MSGEKNSRLTHLYRTRWRDYLSSLETITALQQALKQAAEESAKQIAEIRELLEADRQGAMINDPKKSDVVLFDDSKPHGPFLGPLLPH